MSEEVSNFSAIMQTLEAELKSKITTIKTKYAAEMEPVIGSMPDPSNFEALVNLEFEVKWKMKTFSFDVPKIYSKREVVKFDIPEVRMERDSIKFDVPATKMERKCAFKKPVFRGWKWYSECVYMHVPVIYKKRVEIKLDVPKFNSKRVDFSFDIPEVKMERTSFSTKIPHFYLRSVSGQISDAQLQIEAIGKRMNEEIQAETLAFKTKIDEAIAFEVSSSFDGLRANMIDQRDGISSPYNDAISASKTAIKSLKAQGAQAKVAELESALGDVANRYAETIEIIDENLGNLSEEEAGTRVTVETETIDI